MRIAISGSHCVGKSTLIDEFLRAHPDFVHEPEPYTVMVDDLGEEFSAEPSVEDFQRQLEFNIARLKQHTRGERVIYERCPIDFLAYIECISRSKTDFPIDEALQHLDLIVYLPLNNAIEVDEFPKLRKAVDRRLREIYREDDLGMDLTVIEATGSTEQRLRTIDSFINRG